MNEQQRIADALNRARKVYPHSKITNDQLDEYLDDLSDLPADAVVQAIRECRRTLEFFPTLAAIRNRTVEILAGDTLVDPEAAWGEVIREARRVGLNQYAEYRNGKMIPPEGPKFSSPLIAEAVEAIGWRDICMSTDEQTPVIRSQFRKALEAIQHRAKDRVVSGRQPSGPMLDTGNGAGDLTAIGDRFALREGDDA